MRPWIVMRSHNDVPVIHETIKGLRAQRHPYRLLVLDNASHDGTAELTCNQFISKITRCLYSRNATLLNPAFDGIDANATVLCSFSCGQIGGLLLAHRQGTVPDKMYISSDLDNFDIFDISIAGNAKKT